MARRLIGTWVAASTQAAIRAIAVLIFLSALGPAVAAESGVRIETAPWVPKRDASYGWWGVVAAGDRPNKTVAKTNEQDHLALAPGIYDVYWVQDYDTSDWPLLLARGVTVEADKVAAVQANSGLKLETAGWVPPRDSSYGWWGAAISGSKPRDRLIWSKTADSLLLPPGTYDVYWVQDYDTSDQPLLLARAVTVEAGKVATVQANSGLKLETAGWVPPRDSSYGWWGAAIAGAKPRDRLIWSKTADSVLLPPGTYDVYWVQDYDTSDRPLLLARAVTVEAGKVATVQANSGLKLETAGWVPPRDSSYGWWGAAISGSKPRDRLIWSKTADSLLLPPGAYDVYWVQDYDTSDRPLLLARGVTVEAGKVATVQANSGIGLRVPPDTPALDASHGWWGVTAAGAAADKRLHWSKARFDLPLLLPPGTYDVYWQQDYETKPERRAQGVSVAAGQLVEVDLQQATARVAETAPASADAIPSPGSSVVTQFSVTAKESTGIGTNFSAGIHQVEARYDWKSAAVEHRLGVRWYHEGELVLEQGEPVGAAEGSTGWLLKMSEGSTLPTGRYRVDLVEQGQVGPSHEFTIGAPAVAGADESVQEATTARTAAVAGEIVGQDDFADAASGWSQIKTAATEAGYADGRYRIALQGKHPWTLGSQLSQTIDDAIIEVDAIPIADSPPHPYGIFVRAQGPGSFYAFVIAADGSHAAFHVENWQLTFHSEPNAIMPAGVLAPAGEPNHLQVVAEGAHLTFSVNGREIARVEKAVWSTGRAGLLAGNPGSTPIAITFDNWRVRRLVTGQTAAVAEGGTGPIDFAAYAPKDTSSTIKAVALGQIDADEEGYDPRRAGSVFQEGTTQVVVWLRFAGARPGQAMKSRWYLDDAMIYETEELKLAEDSGTAYWGLVNTDYRPLPAGRYRVDLLEDGRVATAIPFRVDPRPELAGPWQSRGWEPRGEGAYANPAHGLSVDVPAGWTVGDELRFSARVLWVMGKIDPDGRERLTVSIMRRKDRTWKSAEELFESELEELKRTTMTIDGEVKPFSQVVRSGQSERPEVYEIEQLLTHDGSRAHLFLFVRNGVGYVVNIKAHAGATESELAELAAIRNSIGP